MSSANAVKLLSVALLSTACSNAEAVDDGTTPHTGTVVTPNGEFTVEYEVVDGQAVFEGDIVLGTVDESGHLLGDGVEAKSFGISDGSRRFNVGALWPQSLVRYQLSVSDATRRQEAIDAIAHWASRTTLRFVEVTGTMTGDGITISDANTSCSSNVGRIGGVQTVRVGAAHCVFGSIVHELGHAVGLFHEHQRQDRAGFVQGAPTGDATNWDIITSGAQLGDYDLMSIMHYGTNQSPGGTFTRIGGGTIVQNRTELSDGDVRGVQILYGNEFEPTLNAAAVGTNLHVFVRGGDGALHQRRRVGTTWYPSGGTYDELGTPSVAPMIGGPEPVVRSGGRVDVLVRGGDRALYLKGWDGSSWWPAGTAMERIGGLLTSAPSAVATGGERIDVFARGANGDVVHKYFNGAWLPAGDAWESMAGFTVGPVKAVSGGDGTIHLLVVGGDRSVYHRFWNGLSWTAWNNLGGYSVGRIAAARTPSNGVDVVIRGYDGNMHRKQLNGGVWSPTGGTWQLVGTGFNGAASVVARATGQLEIVAQHTATGNLRHNLLPANVFGLLPAWTNLGGEVVGSPSAVSSADGQLSVLVRGGDSGAYQIGRSTASSAWSAFAPLGGWIFW